MNSTGKNTACACGGLESLVRLMMLAGETMRGDAGEAGHWLDAVRTARTSELPLSPSLPFDTLKNTNIVDMRQIPALNMRGARVLFVMMMMMMMKKKI